MSLCLCCLAFLRWRLLLCCRALGLAFLFCVICSCCLRWYFAGLSVGSIGLSLISGVISGIVLYAVSSGINFLSSLGGCFSESSASLGMRGCLYLLSGGSYSLGWLQI